MSKDKVAEGDDEDRAQPQPGPVDEGKDGGMATRELAPELVEDSADEDDSTD